MFSLRNKTNIFELSSIPPLICSFNVSANTIEPGQTPRLPMCLVCLCPFL